MGLKLYFNVYMYNNYNLFNWYFLNNFSWLIDLYCVYCIFLFKDKVIFCRLEWRLVFDCFLFILFFICVGGSFLLGIVGSKMFFRFLWFWIVFCLVLKIVVNLFWFWLLNGFVLLLLLLKFVNVYSNKNCDVFK